MNKYDLRHQRDMARLEQQIMAEYYGMATDFALVGEMVGTPAADRPFSLDDYPLARHRLDGLLTALGAGVAALVLGALRKQWRLSQTKNDALARSVRRKVPRQVRQRMDRHLEELVARREGGLTLSERIWRCTGGYRKEIEAVIARGVKSGSKSAELVQELRQYLRHPSRLAADTDLHPGRGVYRSSFMNARRLAATELHRAYCTADFLRWQQMDWVVGIEVRTSMRHPFRDICDDLAGRYPKDFKFTGWHPHCRCYAVPVLKAPQELAADNRRIAAGEEPAAHSENEVAMPAEGFKTWVENNLKRIAKAKSDPYFIADNYNGRIKEYARYKTDENYYDVAFNYANGGLKATHRLHNFDKVGGQYELNVQKAGYEAGHSVILEAERGKLGRSTEGKWDGREFEVAGRETGTANNILRGLKHCAQKKGSADNIRG